MINALFGINLKDNYYTWPARIADEKDLWQAYLDYHSKFQEQFASQQSQIAQDVKDWAGLFDEYKKNPEFAKELRNRFSLNDADFYAYDEDLMVVGIDQEKAKAELEKRAKYFYPSGMDDSEIRRYSKILSDVEKFEANSL